MRRLPLRCRCSVRGDDDDTVVVAVGYLPGNEHHAAEVDSHVALTLAGLGALTRVGAQRLDPDVEAAQRSGVADRAVDDQPRPSVVDAQTGDDVAHERAV